MKCSYCGAYIPDNELYCESCGMEVQIVPDYNPLEDVLEKQVKGSIEGATKQINIGDTLEYGIPVQQTRQDMATQVLSPERIAKERQRLERQAGVRRKEASKKRDTDSIRRSQKQQEEPQQRQDNGERKRQQQMKKKRLAKRRRKKRLILFAVLLLVIGIGGYFLYQNSYTGQVKKGYEALAQQEFAGAETYFNKAIRKDKKKTEAYTGLSDIYKAQEDLDAAETIFLDAIEEQPSNAELYKAAIAFYVDTDQMEKISELLDDREDDEILAGVGSYVSKTPEFSLEEGIYTEVQEVSLTSSGEEIYYTVDGTIPTAASGIKYTESILLNEGENVIQAISVNKKGVPSLSVQRTYTIDIPIVDAPAITPSTGQYSQETQIKVNVPEGYTAYYTMDGTEPTTASSVYAEPINMPEGKTIFCAILVNGNGKATQITKRNYVLEYE